MSDDLTMHPLYTKPKAAPAPTDAEVERAAKALTAAHHELTTLHGLFACDGFGSYGKAQRDGCDNDGAWDVFVSECWHIDAANTLKVIDDTLAALEAARGG